MLSTVILRGVGCLLLAAAALKLHGLGVDAVGRIGFFSRPEVQLAIVQFEILLGIWLISGKGVVGAWVSALTTFICFAGFSLHQSLAGLGNCGCFGRLSVSPWYATGLDLIVILLVVIGRPDLQTAKELWIETLNSLGIKGLMCIGGVGLLFSMVLTVCHACFGSASAAIAYFRGEKASVQPPMINLGVGRPGEERRVSVEVTNWTNEPINIIGGSADCSCSVVEDLPAAIPARASRAFSVVIRFSGTKGSFARRAKFMLDDGAVSFAVFTYTGQIVPALEVK